MKAELVGGPLDGQEVEVPDTAPQIVLVPYLAQAYEGLPWLPGPAETDLTVPCPADLMYIRATGPVPVRPRYLFHR